MNWLRVNETRLPFLHSHYSNLLGNAFPFHALLLLQSSTAQTCLPVLRAVVQQTADRARETLVLFCFLYPPSSFLDPSRPRADHVRIVDRTANVPGYDDAYESEKEWIAALKSEILETVRSGMSAGSDAFVPLPSGKD